MQFLLIAFISVICIQFYYYFIFSKFYFSKKIRNKKPKVAVSVIICARNEANNITKNLPSIICQEYSNFELVLINDGSSDDTLTIFETLKSKYNSVVPIKIVNVAQNEKFWGNKKFALSLGIKSATHDHLLFIDADCWPNSKNWISEMASRFSDTKEIVLGYGAHQKVKNSLFNKLLRFETAYTAIQYNSYAQFGLTYMGVGRNLGYKKSLFFNNCGFANHMHLKSGDDDLFINRVATKNNVAICFSPESFTTSTPKKNIKEWLLQKRRHISTANYYKAKHKFLLGVSFLTQLIFLSLAAVLLSKMYEWQFVLGLVLLKLVIQYLILGKAINKLKENDLVFWVPIFEIFLILLQLFIFIKNKFTKPTHW
jgi:glycosyltransferase involved in cell wall biosynthesis